MNLQVFLLWMLILVSGISHVYSAFRHHFSGVDHYKTQVAALRERVEREEVRQRLAEYQLRDFQQSVAQIIPENYKTKYQLRNLASIVIAPQDSQMPLEKAGSQFESGKKLFRGGDFEESNDVFRTLIRNFPNSVYAVESYFLLAEGQFQLGEFEDCLETIESMMTLYPESELTGFVLLRMGDIFLRRDRIEDAEQVFRSIQKNFDNAELRRQSDVRLKEVSL